jgi:transcriptional regulator with XRE-family HTH domain
MKDSNTSQRLQQLMRERRLKQVDILNASKPYCEKYGVKLNKSDLSQYVSGKVEPGQDKLFVLGCALNVNEAWLMGFDVQMERTNVLPLADGDNELEMASLNIETTRVMYEADAQTKKIEQHLKKYAKKISVLSDEDIFKVFSIIERIVDVFYDVTVKELVTIENTIL